MSSDWLENDITHKLFTHKSYVYMYKDDLALNNPQGVDMSSNATKPNKIKLRDDFAWFGFFVYISILMGN